MIQCVVKSTNFAKKEMTFVAGGMEVVAKVVADDVFFNDYKSDDKSGKGVPALATFMSWNNRLVVTELRFDLTNAKEVNPFGDAVKQVEVADI